MIDLPGLGAGYRTPAHPLYHAVNALRITSPAPDAGAIAAAADDVLAGLGHRFLIVEGPAGPRVAPDLVRRGYAAEDHVFMALRRPRDRPPAPGLAREANEAELEAVEAQTTAEAPHGGDPAVVAALTAGRRLLHAAAPGTRFVVAGADGQDAAHATLYADGRIAQVEDVATRTAFRGRGLARAVVSLACELAAAHELVFIVADEADWPKALYARLGFDPVGHAWAFTKLL